jgi:hypothetical protein
MTIMKSFSLTFTLILVCALFTIARAQTPRISTVNITAESDKVHIAAAGDVSEMSVEVSNEAGEVVFQSGAMTGNRLDWNVRDAQRGRASSGTYLVTVTFRTAAGKLRKRVEQVTVTGGEKSRAQATAALAPHAAQATITGSGTTNRIAKFTGASTIGDTSITATGGRIGIGTDAPTSILTVVGAQANSPAVLANNDATGGIGVKGKSSDDTGVGVWGIHIATTGTTPGVKGETNSTADNAIAVLGVVNPTAAGDHSVAVKGINNDTSLLGCGVCGTPIGVWGEQAKNGFGVYGFAPDGVGVYGNSNSGTGVYAQSSSGVGVSGNSSSNDGVSGSSTSGKAVHGTSAGGYAGYFDGKVKVTGLLEADGGCTGCTMTSDRNLKANFSAINPRFVLNRLAAIPIRAWNYKSDEPTVRHIGPTAQDFRTAFNLGVDDKHIDMVDANGVTMAAVQGLYQMMLEKEKTNREKDVKIEQLSQQVERLQARLAQVERTVKKRRK